MDAHLGRKPRGRRSPGRIKLAVSRCGVRTAVWSRGHRGSSVSIWRA